MAAFALDVVVPCTCGREGDSTPSAKGSGCTCEAILMKTTVEESSSSNVIVVASASSVGMSLDRQIALTNDSHVSLLAIFVPPSLLASFDYRTVGEATNCAAVWTIKDESSRAEISSNLLSSVHPFLVEHGKLFGIVLACHEKGDPAPADLILINVSNAPQHWLHDLKASLNGEHMTAAPEAVLKLIPVSSLIVRTAAPGTADTDRLSKSSSQIPTCPVCLHRIDPVRLGMPKPQNHQLCSKFCPGAVAAGHTGEPCRNHVFLRPWPPASNCIACHVIHDRWKNYLSAAASDSVEQVESLSEKDDLFCHQCAMQETLWVCLTCGFVGCGRYSQRHAAQHFEETGHPYSLELATLRIWDYITSEFAHRGDLLECPSVQRCKGPLPAAAEKLMAQESEFPGNYFNANMANQVGRSDTRSFDEASPKKANMIGEEYEALLQSALEDQAQHYEGEITRLRAELTAENVDAGTMTKEEEKEIEGLKTDIARFRGEIERLSRQLLDAQAQEAGYRADSQRLLREQSVAKDLLDKIQEEAARENMEGQVQMEELEQQVADLTANLRMRHQFSQDQELTNAQIFGMNSSDTRSSKRGKKLRRLFRK